jgi:hypothetical protein
MRRLLSEKFYGMNELIHKADITPANYKTLFPIMVFDVSKQSERLKTEVVDIQIKATFNTAVPAGTEAFAVVVSDRMLQFQSDGKGKVFCSILGASLKISIHIFV